MIHTSRVLAYREEKKNVDKHTHMGTRRYTTHTYKENVKSCWQWLRFQISAVFHADVDSECSTDLG